MVLYGAAQSGTTATAALLHTHALCAPRLFLACLHRHPLHAGTSLPLPPMPLPPSTPASRVPAPLFAGAEAKSLHLVSQTFADPPALLAGALALARSIAAKSPLAVVGTKRVLLHQRCALQGPARRQGCGPGLWVGT